MIGRREFISGSAAAVVGRYAQVQTGPFRFARKVDRTNRAAAMAFGEWLPETSPDLRWDWPYQRYIQDKLDQVTAGGIDRIMFFAPPRHGKTEAITVRYPVYRMERNPQIRVIQAAYNQTLAAKFSRKSRRLARARGIALSEERTAVNDWETAAGGGLRAVGAGAGIAGHGGDLILIDDPVKNREEAESLTYRDKVWEWWTDDLWTRREPGAAVILSLTRWHHDDLAGRILNSPDGKRWVVVRLPALAEENDPLGRHVGEALCSERFDEEWLRQQQEIMGEYAFESLYQGRPTPRTGNMFPRGKVQLVPAAPAGTSWCRAWDKAGTQGAGKRSAGVKIGKGPDGLWYVGNVVKGQWAAAQRETEIRSTATLDGVGVLIEIEQEPGSGGKESAESTVRGLAGYTVEARTATGDKVTRAHPFAAQWQAGNVRIVVGNHPPPPSWVHEYLDEMELAPHGKFVDQMDGSAAGFNRLALHQVAFTPIRVRMG